jgi:hypothetical protein
MMSEEGLPSQAVMSERQRRRSLNEAVFREVNERILEVNERFESDPQTLDLICECDDTDCADRISMSAADYEQVRADSRQFAIVPGHSDATVEVVIAHEKTYELVRKRPGEAAAIAQETDPREP